jgi:hypothetical protein
VLQENEGEDLEADVDAEELEGQVQGEVDEGEAGVVRQGEAERRLETRREDLHLDARLRGHGHRGAQEPQDPGLDLADVVQDDRGGALECLAAQHRPHVRLPRCAILSITGCFSFFFPPPGIYSSIFGHFWAQLPPPLITHTHPPPTAY